MRNSFKKKIINIVNNNLPNKNNISLAEEKLDLTNIGLDSITFINIIIEIEEKLNIEIPDDYILISKMNTLEKIINIVSQVVINKEK